MRVAIKLRVDLGGIALIANWSIRVACCTSLTRMAALQDFAVSSKKSSSSGDMFFAAIHCVTCCGLKVWLRHLSWHSRSRILVLTLTSSPCGQGVTGIYDSRVRHPNPNLNISHGLVQTFISFCVAGFIHTKKKIKFCITLLLWWVGLHAPWMS